MLLCKNLITVHPDEYHGERRQQVDMILTQEMPIMEPKSWTDRSIVGIGFPYDKQDRICALLVRLIDNRTTSSGAGTNKPSELFPADLIAREGQFFSGKASLTLKQLNDVFHHGRVHLPLRHLYVETIVTEDS